MTIIHLATKPNWRWTFCTVALILSLGLIWLALEEGGEHSRGISGGSSSPDSINVSPHVSSNSGNRMLLSWELGLRPGFLVPAGGERSMAAAHEDNATALALGSAGALTLVGLVLLLAWKLRQSSPAGIKELNLHWFTPARRAPPI